MRRTVGRSLLLECLVEPRDGMVVHFAVMLSRDRRVEGDDAHRITADRIVQWPRSPGEIVVIYKGAAKSVPIVVIPGNDDVRRREPREAPEKR
jgi:hypothetical protein